MTDRGFIELEGVRVNNLRSVDVHMRRNALTVICGVSGSGKSSLAFDTLAAEGQRRYIETFSPSARQFLDRIERPAADRMTGLPPAIALRQQLRSDGLRSTFGTRTETIEPLRVVFAQLGVIRCSSCDRDVVATNAEAAAADVVAKADGRRIQIVAPLQAVEGRGTIDVGDLLKAGFTRAIVDGRVVDLQSERSLVVQSLEVVVDRLRADSGSQARLAESIGQAMTLASGWCDVLVEGYVEAARAVTVDDAAWSVLEFTIRLQCRGCRREFAAPTPESLSFTSPLGACPNCEGTGIVRNAEMRSKSSRRTVRRDAETCPVCLGSRLNADAECLRVRGRSIGDVCAWEARDVVDWLSEIFVIPDDGVVVHAGRLPAAQVEQLTRRLRLIVDSGLGYLSLDRSASSLSGGESQRAGLVAALGSGLTQTLYVLDEPTAGLHDLDTARIVALVRNLQRAGNTVVVVEHDMAFLEEADEIIEIGPGAGAAGGAIVFQGSVDELRRCGSVTGVAFGRWCDAGKNNRPTGLTGLTGRTSLTKSTVAHEQPRPPEEYRHPAGWLTASAITCHNLHDVSVKLPLGVLCVVTGVSGSGKSSLVVDALYPAIAQRLGEAHVTGRGAVLQLDGCDQIESVMLLDQRPVPRSRRSLPATWIGVFDDIRSLLAETHEARKRNASKALFSFNAKSGGRCPVCEGRGMTTVAMQFLADIETVCEECQGRRFRPDVLEIRYRDRSIHDILNMTADEAFVFFNGHHRIQQRLNALRQAGLGYLRLGQSLSTVSGGEAQRLRIAALLAGLPLTDGEVAADNRKPAALTRAGRTLFLLDEPTTGLHAADVDLLLECIEFLLQTGHTVVAIDHDSQLINESDWHIKLGPGAGCEGGRIVYEGLPTVST